MNKPSLKQIVLTELMKEGYLSLEKVHALARANNHKESMIERRLRPSESPLIESVKNSKGFIEGYRYKLHNTIENAKRTEDFAPRLSRLFEL